MILDTFRLMGEIPSIQNRRTHEKSKLTEIRHNFKTDSCDGENGPNVS